MNKFSLLMQCACVISMTTAPLIICSDEKRQNKEASAAIKAVANINQKSSQTTDANLQKKSPQKPQKKYKFCYYCPDCGHFDTDPNSCHNPYCH